jgi:voltage-gated potassium channel
MKYLSSMLGYLAHRRSARQNLRQLIKFLAVLTALVVVYSILFHFLMAYEGEDYSWITGLYWTLTVMTTLGFGDITFHSDLGRLFSIMVLMSGVIFLLTLLPFTFIKFFYAPWMEAESRRRTPKELPPETQGHILLMAYDPVTMALIKKLESHQYKYVVVVEDQRKALELHDMEIHAAVGAIDDPETYRRMRVDQAALVVATHADEINTNIAFTVRELSDKVPIITTADSPHSEDILQMAGSTRVLKLHDMLGRSLATWTVGGDCRSTVISEFDKLVLAEFPAMGTPLIGKTLAESRLREDLGVSVVGLWERGQFIVAAAQRKIERYSVLLLAGSREDIASFDDVYSFYHVCNLTANPVLIIGGGRVGQTIAERFEEREMAYLIIEKNPRRAQDETYVVGDAADIRTLQKAWIEKAPAALLTTHDDATNIYLTKYLRSLRPDMQILSRSNLERNVSTLHRAGADFVMSYPTLGATAIFNFLKKEDTLLLVEGLNVFHLKAPKALIGKTLAESKVRETTGCSVVAIKVDDGMTINPDPHKPIVANAELMLIGTYEGEQKLLQWAQG